MQGAGGDRGLQRTGDRRRKRAEGGRGAGGSRGPKEAGENRRYGAEEVGVWIRHDAGGGVWGEKMGVGRRGKRDGEIRRQGNLRLVEIRRLKRQGRWGGRYLFCSRWRWEIR